MAKTVTVSNFVDKAMYVDRIWEILKESYAQVKGGFLYKSKKELLATTSSWKLIYYKNEIVAVLIYKDKVGKKIVAFGRDKKYGKFSIKNLAITLESSLHYAWMEVSDQAEEFILKYCNVHHLLLHQSKACELLHKPILPLEDGYHYLREIAGIKKSKLIIGSPAKLT